MKRTIAARLLTGSVAVFVGFTATLAVARPADAVTGWVTASAVSEVSASSARTYAAVYAYCPPGTLILGGGVDILGGDGAVAVATQSGLAAYDTSKGGVLMFTKNLALELAPHGIRVNMIAPGGITTPGVSKPMEGSGMDAEQMRELITRFTALIPMGRFGEPEELNGAIQWLCSDAASFVTGASYTVDGGLLAVDPGALAFEQG